MRDAPDGHLLTSGASARLFGRLEEASLLADAFARVSAIGTSEIVLLSGPAGIGKSALVRRFRSLLRVGRHRFAEGKADQTQAGVTLGPVIQALRLLIDAALGDSDTALAALRARLHAAVGGRSRLVTDLLPEAEALLGQAAPLPEVPAALAQARLQRAMIATLGAFAENGQPLLLFIDDVQWADAGTIALLAAFAKEPPANILLMVSCRDGAAEDFGGVDGLVAALRESGIRLTETPLAPLSLSSTAEAVAFALGAAAAEIRPLADAIQAQARGNPFMIEHVLRRLIEEGIMHRQGGANGWSWDSGRLGGLAVGGDVLDFIGGRLARLDASRQPVVATLAVFGGRAETSLVAAQLGWPPGKVEAAVEDLLAVGLLKREGAVIALPHDRILEAAILLTPEETRPAAHARAARLRMTRSRILSAEQMFEVAGHVLRVARAGAPVPLRPSHWLRLAQVLRDAIGVSVRAGDTASALLYIDAAAAIAREAWWKERPGFAFDIAFLRAESLLLRGDVQGAEQAIAALLARELRPRDRAATYKLLAGLKTVQSHYEDATAAALSGLALMGHPLRRSPSLDECRAASERIRSLMGDTPGEALAQLPLADEDAALTTSLLSALIVCTFTGDNLRFMHVAKIVELTMTSGVTADSAYGLAWYGVMIADFEGRYRDGFAYGQAAVALIDRHGFEGQRTGVLVAMDQLSPWTQPFEFALAQVHEAIVAADAAGDLAMKCYARNHLVSDLLQMGRPLSQAEAEAEKGLQLTRRVAFRDIELLLAAQLSFARCLRTGAFAEVPELGLVASASTRFWIHLYDGIAAYLFDDLDRAAAAFAGAAPLCWALPAHIDRVYYAFFSALTSARHLPEAQALAATEAFRQQFVQWAPLNPEVFRHKLLLIDGEIARLRGQPLDALRLYDQAIAEAGSFVHERALAREAAARHCRQQGLEGLAAQYFHVAAAEFRLWGAAAKAERMQHLWPDIGAASPEAGLLDTLRAVSAMGKVTDVEALRLEVLRLLMDQAEADEGKLLIIHDGDPVIEVEGRRTAAGLAFETATLIPIPQRVEPEILAGVIQTQQPCLKDAPVLAEGVTELRTTLGVPLRSADCLVGIGYLELGPRQAGKRLAKLPALQLLADQAAISLERARSQAAKSENYERRAQAEAALRMARGELAHRSRLATMGGLAASIAHEINQPLSTIVSYASAGSRWLKRAEPDLHEALQSFAAIQLAGLRAAEIVAALRSLAKQDNLQREVLDLNLIIRDVLELTEPEIAAGQIRLAVDLPEEPRLVLADRVQVQQLVVNLVNNAIDAMAETAPAERLLSVSCSESGAGWLTRIEDRGSGIPPGILSKIFDPLFSTKAKGIGMGLAICKSVVEAHQGAMEVGPSAGGGTSVAFVLPKAGRSEGGFGNAAAASADGVTPA